LPADALASGEVYRAALDDTTLVCLSLVSTNSPARARYLVRRVRRRVPRAMVLVGFWGSSPSELGDAVVQIAISADIVVASLRDAVAKIDPIPASASAPARVDSPPHPDVLAPSLRSRARGAAAD